MEQPKQPQPFKIQQANQLLTAAHAQCKNRHEQFPSQTASGAIQCFGLQAPADLQRDHPRQPEALINQYANNLILIDESSAFVVSFAPLKNQPRQAGFVS
jgi:hypothetical protein